MLLILLLQFFRKPCSAHKIKEITGSGIFVANGEDEESEEGSANPTPNNKTGLRMYQVYIFLSFFLKNFCNEVIVVYMQFIPSL